MLSLIFDNLLYNPTTQFFEFLHKISLLPCEFCKAISEIWGLFQEVDHSNLINIICFIIQPVFILGWDLFLSLQAWKEALFVHINWLCKRHEARFENIKGMGIRWHKEVGPWSPWTVVQPEFLLALTIFGNIMSYIMGFESSYRQFWLWIMEYNKDYGI